MPKWLIILAVILFIVGIGLLIVGIVEHEDKGKKTSNNKILIGAGLALALIGLIIIIWAIVSKFKSKPSAESITIRNETVQAPPNMMSRPYGYQAMTPRYDANMMGPQDYNAMGFSPMAYPNSPMAQPMMPQQQPMMMNYGYQNQFSI